MWRAHAIRWLCCAACQLRACCHQGCAHRSLSHLPAARAQRLQVWRVQLVVHRLQQSVVTRLTHTASPQVTSRIRYPRQQHLQQLHLSSAHLHPHTWLCHCHLCQQLLQHHQRRNHHGPCQRHLIRELLSCRRGCALMQRPNHGGWQRSGRPLRACQLTMTTAQVGGVQGWLWAAHMQTRSPCARLWTRVQPPGLRVSPQHWVHWGEHSVTALHLLPPLPAIQ